MKLTDAWPLTSVFDGFSIGVKETPVRGGYEGVWFWWRREIAVSRRTSKPGSAVIQSYPGQVYACPSLLRGLYSADSPNSRSRPKNKCRLQLKCDGTRRCTGGEVKGKLANAVGSQYSSHYLGMVYPALLPLMRTPRLPVVD